MTRIFQSVGSPDRLVDRVYNEIEQKIIDGQLVPGEKLPSERDLGIELGVSRTVIREAISILVARGLLEKRPGIGTTVRRTTRDQIVRPLNLILKEQGGVISFEHLHQVRSILEQQIASLAAKQCDEKHIEFLKRNLLEMELAVGDVEELIHKDMEFHRALAEATNNPLLLLLLDTVTDLFDEYLHKVMSYIDPLEEIIPYHREILSAIQARDENAANEAMWKHLKNIRKLTKRITDNHLNSG